MKLSGDQKKALNSLLDWHGSENKGQFITLGGYAGTGKTTLISLLRQRLWSKNKKLKVAFCSYTGKAARVLRLRLSGSGSLLSQDFVGTIHSLIYSPIEDEKTKEIIGWKLKSKIEADLIVIDEASMVDGAIWRDLLSFGLPIIAVGDHGQLPPIKESFNLMASPQLILEEIHRQAKDNPIIKLSLLARQEGKIPSGTFGKRVAKMNRQEVEARMAMEELLANYNDETLVLCGFNLTRIRLNRQIRQFLGFVEPVPQRNDRVICLRNNHEAGIFNGMLGTVLSLKDKNEEWYKVKIAMDGEESSYRGQILKKQFNSREPINFTEYRRLATQGDLFDFGYALTVHKAQGSQARRVILFEERFSKMDDETWRRWLYTAVTRAEEELFIFG